MKPGREIDLLIAEKVMGWNAAGYTKDATLLVPVFATEVPNYSTDIAASEDLVKQLFRMGWTTILFKYKGEEEILVQLVRDDDEREIWTDEYLPKPYAICLAALKALGITI